MCKSTFREELPSLILTYSLSYTVDNYARTVIPTKGRNVASRIKSILLVYSDIELDCGYHAALASAPTQNR